MPVLLVALTLALHAARAQVDPDSASCTPSVIDTNANCELSTEEVSATGLFQGADSDGDGDIDHAEMRTFIGKVGGPHFDEADEILAAADSALLTVDRGTEGITGGDLVKHWSLIASRMSLDDVVNWVEHAVQLPQYTAAARRLGLTGFDLPSLLEGEVLEEMGVVSAVHRARFARALKIRLLGMASVPPAPELRCECRHGAAVLSWQLSYSDTNGGGVIGAPGGIAPHKALIFGRGAAADHDASLPWRLIAELGAAELSYVSEMASADGDVVEFRLELWNVVGVSESVKIEVPTLCNAITIKSDQYDASSSSRIEETLFSEADDDGDGDIDLSEMRDFIQEEFGVLEGPSAFAATVQASGETIGSFQSLSAQASMDESQIQEGVRSAVGVRNHIVDGHFDTVSEVQQGVDAAFHKMDHNEDDLILRHDFRAHFRDRLRSLLTPEGMARWARHAARLPLFAKIFRREGVTGLDLPKLLENNGKGLIELAIAKSPWDEARGELPGQTGRITEQHVARLQRSFKMRLYGVASSPVQPVMVVQPSSNACGGVTLAWSLGADAQADFGGGEAAEGIVESNRAATSATTRFALPVHELRLLRRVSARGVTGIRRTSRRHSNVGSDVNPNMVGTEVANDAVNDPHPSPAGLRASAAESGSGWELLYEGEGDINGYEDEDLDVSEKYDYRLEVWNLVGSTSTLVESVIPSSPQGLNCLLNAHRTLSESTALDNHGVGKPARGPRDLGFTSRGLVFEVFWFMATTPIYGVLWVLDHFQLVFLISSLAFLRIRNPESFARFANAASPMLEAVGGSHGLGRRALARLIVEDPQNGSQDGIATHTGGADALRRLGANLDHISPRSRTQIEAVQALSRTSRRNKSIGPRVKSSVSSLPPLAPCNQRSISSGSVESADLSSNVGGSGSGYTSDPGIADASSPQHRSSPVAISAQHPPIAQRCSSEDNLRSMSDFGEGNSDGSVPASSSADPTAVTAQPSSRSEVQTKSKWSLVRRRLKAIKRSGESGVSTAATFDKNEDAETSTLRISRELQPSSRHSLPATQLDLSSSSPSRKSRSVGSEGGSLRCEHPGCSVTFSLLNKYKRHHCGGCQGVFCVKHTAYHPHIAVSSCGVNSRCRCYECFKSPSPTTSY